MKTDGDNSHVKRREAILLSQWNMNTEHLYLSLVVMPDGHAFTVRDNAVLLFDHEPSFDDVSVTESFYRAPSSAGPSFLVSVNDGKYCMHDAYMAFARGKLSDRRDILWETVERWTKSISSLDAVRSSSKGIWDMITPTC